MEKKTEPKYGKYRRLKRSSRSRKRKFHGNQSTLLLEKQVVEEDQTTVQGQGDVESITATETYSEHVDASSTSVPAPLSASAKKIQAVDVPKETDLALECNYY